MARRWPAMAGRQKDETASYNLTHAEALTLSSSMGELRVVVVVVAVALVVVVAAAMVAFISNPTCARGLTPAEALWTTSSVRSEGRARNNARSRRTSQREVRPGGASKTAEVGGQNRCRSQAAAGQDRGLLTCRAQGLNGWAGLGEAAQAWVPPLATAVWADL